jgi:DNA-binding response OmpR family regulator
MRLREECEMGEIENKVDIPAEEEVRVLFIEDDADLAEMYTVKLELDGYTVTRAADGEEGLRLAAEIEPDIVFLDIRLPKMDGFDVLGRLRADDRLKHLPVIILSNYGEQELIERGMRLGALEFLVKADTTPAGLSGSVMGWIKE